MAEVSVFTVQEAGVSRKTGNGSRVKTTLTLANRVTATLATDANDMAMAGEVTTPPRTPSWTCPILTNWRTGPVARRMTIAWTRIRSKKPVSTPNTLLIQRHHKSANSSGKR